MSTTAVASKQLTPAEIEAQLGYFTGTEGFHRLSPFKFYLTDGALFLCQQAGAFWLACEIAARQPKVSEKCGGFQIWRLTRHEDSTATLECLRDISGSPDDLVHSVVIPYTDFPLAQIEMYCADNEFGPTLMVKGEY